MSILKQLRKDKKLKISDICERGGFSKFTYRRIELGERPLKPAEAERLAPLFRVPAETLLDLPAPDTPPVIWIDCVSHSGETVSSPIPCSPKLFLNYDPTRPPYALQSFGDGLTEYGVLDYDTVIIDPSRTPVSASLLHGKVHSVPSLIYWADRGDHVDIFHMGKVIKSAEVEVLGVAIRIIRRAPRLQF